MLINAITNAISDVAVFSCSHIRVIPVMLITSRLGILNGCELEIWLSAGFVRSGMQHIPATTERKACTQTEKAPKLS